MQRRTTFAISIAAILLIVLTFVSIRFSASVENSTSDRGGDTGKNEIISTRIILEYADSLRAMAEFNRALSIYSTAKSRFKKLNKWDNYVYANVAKAEILGEMGRYEDARFELSETLNPEYHIGPMSGISRGSIHSQLGRMLVRLDRFTEAKSHLSTALTLAQSSGGNAVTLEGRTLQAYGLFYHFQGDYDRALDMYEQSFSALSMSKGPASIEATVPLNNIANIYYRLGEFEKATQLHNRVLATRETWLRKDHPLTAMSFGNLGNLLYAVGDYESALQHHRKAASIWSESFGSEHPELAASFNNMGRALTALRRFDEAYNILHESLNQNVKLLGPSNDRTAISYGAVGEVNLYLNRLDIAEAWLLKAIYVWELKKLDNHTSYWSALRDLALVYVKRSKELEAISLLNKVFDLSSISPHPFSVRILNDLAEIEINGLKSEGRIAAINRALAVNTASSGQADGSTNPSIYGALDSHELLRSLTLKTTVLRDLATRQENPLYLTYALQTLQRASELSAKLLQEQALSGSKSLLAQKADEIHAEAIIVALDLYKRTSEKRYLILAFYFAEKRKSRSLIDSIAALDARKRVGLDTMLVRREKSFRLAISYQKRQIAELFALDIVDSLEISRARNRLFETERKQSHYSDALAVNFPKYYSLKQNVSTISATEIQSELLDDDTALIEYVIHDSTLISFVITADSVYVKSSIIPDDFDSLVSNLRRAIQHRHDQDYLKYAHIIYKILFEPIEPILTETNLLIIPEGIIHLVPFDALLTERVHRSDSTHYFVRYSELPYLIRNKSISYAYSATLLNQSIKRHREPPTKMLFAVAPAFPPGTKLDSTTIEFLRLNGVDTTDPLLAIAPLPGSREEVEQIGEIFRRQEGLVKRLFDSKSTILVNDDATEIALKTSSLSSFRYLHIATHSFISTIDPSLSGMLLWPGAGGSKEDGILRAGEIFNLDLNAELVVLSACDTGTEVLQNIEGNLGLSRGFIYAGAKNLIVSLWPSDDVGTKYLMVHLYENISSRQTIKSAIRNAKMTLIKEGGILAKPYFWSPFIHIGA